MAYWSERFVAEIQVYVEHLLLDAGCDESLAQQLSLPVTCTMLIVSTLTLYSVSVVGAVKAKKASKAKKEGGVAPPAQLEATEDTESKEDS